jgi:23S rRNA pseudouridine1911/1915/1917 synthase
MAEPWRVPEAAAGERLDRLLSLVTGLSRSEATGLIDAGRVKVSGRVASSRSARVRSGQLVEVEGELAPEGSALAGDRSVDVPVVWFDAHLVVVDKPPGLVVHPGAGNLSGTLVHGLLARFPDLADLASPAADPRGGREAGRRPGVVHRLDKGTSGLLVVARTAVARDELVRQLAERRMGREYLCLIEGEVDSDAGVIDAPLGRSTSDPTRMRVQAGGRWARTHYEVIHRATGPVPATMVRCRLETGRTHQVRVHFASIGHPVVGDDRYGRADEPWHPLPRGRHFLHAELLSFEHPVSGEPLVFTSRLPDDLASLAAGLEPPCYLSPLPRARLGPEEEATGHGAKGHEAKGHENGVR